MDTLFSIIIPYYNTPVYLTRLLESIDVTDSSIQVIVVDDRSTVGLEEYLKCKRTYQKRGIEFYKNKKNKGAGACRNVGLKYAKGRWILFADADDIFLPGYKKEINRYVESNADIIFFAPTSREEDTGELSTRHITMERDIYNCHLKNDKKDASIKLKYRNVVPWSKMIRHSVIKENNICFDEVMYSNDAMFSVKLAYFSNIIETSLVPIYCCMRNENSLTSKVSIDVYRMRRSVWIRKYIFLQEHLPKEDFSILDLSGANYIFRGINQKIGISVIIETIMMFLRYHIKLLPEHMFTMDFWKEYVIPNLNEWKEAKKYFNRKKDK